MTPAQARIQHWKRDPVAFVRDNFGVEPDAWQIDVLEAFADPSKPRISMQACVGPGKAQPVDMQLDTPAGPRRWGNLQPGDEVWAPDGTAARIAATHRRGTLPIYRITFGDGASALACGDHLWKVRGRTERRYWKDDNRSRPARSKAYSRNNRTITGLTDDGYSVLSTEEIIARNDCGDGVHRQFEIPRHEAVRYPRATLLLDPYVLGVWLGDGGKSTGRGSWRDADIDQEIERRGYRLRRSLDGCSVTVYGITGALRELGVFHLGSPHRRIPEAYRHASVEQRAALLTGLMDTDGTIGKDGSMSFDVTSEALVCDVEWLTRSLGGVARRRKVKETSYRDPSGKLIQCLPCHRVTVTLSFCPFVVKRKAERWSMPQERYLTRYIDRIEEAGAAECMCIEVEHPSHCYLANDFIVTHNSTVLAWCGWNFLACYGAIGEHPKGFAVAVTQDNLRANLWPEFSKWQRKSPFLSAAFTWTGERIYANDHRATWFLEARSWPKTATPEEQGKTLSGLHGHYVLALIDESGSIPTAVLRAGDQALSSTNLVFGKIMQAGNPLSRDGMLYAASSQLSHLWHVVRITGDPEDPKRSPRINLDWAREQIAAYGRDNPWVMAHILGKFPESALNTLLTSDDVRDAQKRFYREHEIDHAARILGVDVAREGMDKSVIFPRQGRVAFPPKILRNVDSLQGAGEVARKWQEWRPEACFIDNTGGFGAGWIDQLRALNYAPVGIHFAGAAGDASYVNKRAEMWFLMAQWVKEGGALPDIPELVAELSEPVYYFKGDRFQMEEKEQVKRRLGRSPDLGDALVLTFAHPVAKPDLVSVAAKRFASASGSVEHNARRGYNPYGKGVLRHLKPPR